jgi:hypothetical protein
MQSASKLIEARFHRCYGFVRAQNVPIEAEKDTER